MGLTLGIVIGVAVITGGYQFVGSKLLETMASGSDPMIVFLAYFVFMVSYYALTFFLTAGETVALLKLARNRDASFEDVFGAGRFFWRIVGSSILVILLGFALVTACVLPALVGVAATMNVPQTGVRIAVVVALGLLGVAGMIVGMVRLMQYTYVLIDTDCGPIEAIQGSIEITRGHTGELFVITLLASLIGFSGILACGVGLIFTFPLATLMMPCAYVCLTGRGAPVFDTGNKPLRNDIEFIDFTS